MDGLGSLIAFAVLTLMASVIPAALKKKAKKETGENPADTTSAPAPWTWWGDEEQEREEVIVREEEHVDNPGYEWGRDGEHYKSIYEGISPDYHMNTELHTDILADEPISVSLLEDDGDSKPEVEFDLTSAVIYSEILKPKFSELE